MLRRNIRLRKEYLYKKQQEKQVKEEFNQKQKLKKALEEDKPLSADIRKEAYKLRDKIELEDENTMIPRSHIDDEYQFAGLNPPKILLTTCRNPSSRLSQFAKELKLIFPNSLRINRGSYYVKKLVEVCNQHDFSDLIIVHEHRGVPDGLIVSHLPTGPTAYFALHNVVLRHDLSEKPDNLSLQYPHLIFEGFQSRLGDRVCDILKYLFPVPKSDSKRVITFHNQNDVIQFRHHL